MYHLPLRFVNIDTNICTLPFTRSHLCMRQCVLFESTWQKLSIFQRCFAMITSSTPMQLSQSMAINRSFLLHEMDLCKCVLLYFSHICISFIYTKCIFWISLFQEIVDVVAYISINDSQFKHTIVHHVKRIHNIT